MTEYFCDKESRMEGGVGRASQYLSVETLKGKKKKESVNGRACEIEAERERESE